MELPRVAADAIRTCLLAVLVSMLRDHIVTWMPRGRRLYFVALAVNDGRRGMGDTFAILGHADRPPGVAHNRLHLLLPAELLQLFLPASLAVEQSLSIACCNVLHRVRPRVGALGVRLGQLVRSATVWSTATARGADGR